MVDLVDRLLAHLFAALIVGGPVVVVGIVCWNLGV
jgi:hypothetical protein